jgi:hypothetical protein
MLVLNAPIIYIHGKGRHARYGFKKVIILRRAAPM